MGPHLVKVRTPGVTKVSGPPNQCRDDQAGAASYSEVVQRGRPRQWHARACWCVRPGSAAATSGCWLAKGSREWKAPRVRSSIVAFASGGRRRPYKARHRAKGSSGPAGRWRARRNDSPKGPQGFGRGWPSVQSSLSFIIQKEGDVGERQGVSELDQLGVNPRPHGCGSGGW